MRRSLLHRGLLAALPALALAAAPGPAAWAQAPDAAPVIRAGDHPGFGRLVFEFHQRMEYEVTRDGDRVTIRFPGTEEAPAPERLPRNVRSLTPAGDAMEILLTPGTGLRHTRFGNRIVLDLLNPRPPQRGREPVPSSPPPARIAEGEAKPALTQAGGAGARLAAPNVQSAAAGPNGTSSPQPVPARGEAGPQPLADPDPGQAAKPAHSRMAMLNPPGEATAREHPPAVQAPVRPVAAKNPADPAPAPPVSAGPPAPDEPGNAPAAPTSRPVPALAADPVPPLPSPSGPIALAVRPASPPADTEGSAILVPFSPEVGAAAYRRSDMAVIIFDTPQPLDMAPMRPDPVFGEGSVQLFAEATALRLPLTRDRQLHLSRVAQGWLISVLPHATPLRPIELAQDGGGLKLAADAPGRVVTVTDPVTGQNLLVGTQRRDGQGMPAYRRLPELALEPTPLGVVAAPVSDRIALRAVKDGFMLSQGGGALRLSASPSAGDVALEAARLTRRFDLPDLATPTLRTRLQHEFDAAARVPPLSRAVPRRKAAEAMIALGMGAEAGGMLELARTEDARIANDPDVIGLAAIAALLAGRVQESGGLEDPRLSGTDEIALWRAVRSAMLTEGSPSAAAAFTATLPLILTYPAALRSRLLPLAAETMALGGESAAAASLIAARPADASLAFARGLVLAQKGDVDGALSAFDSLAQAHDRLTRARAASRAVELRYAAGRLDTAGAADALEQQLFAWRGDDRELTLRLRVAELRADQGAWRTSLSLLREADAAWPDDHARIAVRMSAILDKLLRSGTVEKLRPLDLVALAEENAAIIPDGAAGDRLAGLLADRLTALDLPGRAAPVLRRMMQAASGETRAALGARLAGLMLEQHDPAAALSELQASAADPVSPDLAGHRAVLSARALAARGDATGAIAALEPVQSAEADELRADLLSQSKDWHGAEAALQSLAARVVPAEGALNPDQQTILLRLASAAAQAGDQQTLQELRDRAGPRMQDSKLGEMFRLITAAPVSSVSDLPRAKAELALARALPATLGGLAPR